MSGVSVVCSATPERALELGKAAEHIVCADLILSGYRAYLTDQGLPYDVVVDMGGKLLRVQVKGTTGLRNVPQRVADTPRYMWHVRRAGKGAARRIGNDEFEILALVALDIRKVAYLPITDRVRQTVHLKPPGALSTDRQQAQAINKCIDQYSFADAASEILQ